MYCDAEFPSLKGFDFGLDRRLPHYVFRCKSRQIARFRLLSWHLRQSPARLAFFDILRHNWAIHIRSQEMKSRHIARNRFNSPFAALGQILGQSAA